MIWIRHVAKTTPIIQIIRDVQAGNKVHHLYGKHLGFGYMELKSCTHIENTKAVVHHNSDVVVDICEAEQLLLRCSLVLIGLVRRILAPRR
jgi:hypothetical protein